MHEKFARGQRVKLEDLMVLRCSPDIGSKDLNNVKVGQGQPRLII